MVAKISSAPDIGALSPSSQASVPEPVVLIIADISGYTRYMTANAKTLAHSQTIITELVKALLHEVQLPLELAKLEGDAVFLFCRKAHFNVETGRALGQKLLKFFLIFREKTDELSQSTVCNCNACTHIETLRLKVVVHSGEALFHSVLHLQELAGVDVIIAHRLLKNSVEANQYLLLTENARKDIVFDEPLEFTSGAEHCEGIGSVTTFVHVPQAGTNLAASSPHADPHQEHARMPFSAQFHQSWNWYWKLWFAPFKGTAAKNVTFRNLSIESSRMGRAALSFFSFLLAPLFVPVAAVIILFHSMANQKHRHKTDGSCCSSD